MRSLSYDAPWQRDGALLLAFKTFIHQPFPCGAGRARIIALVARPHSWRLAAGMRPCLAISSIRLGTSWTLVSTMNCPIFGDVNQEKSRI